VFDVAPDDEHMRRLIEAYTEGPRKMVGNFQSCSHLIIGIREQRPDPILSIAVHSVFGSARIGTSQVQTIYGSRTGGLARTRRRPWFSCRIFVRVWIIRTPP
jgi:hypothetical protein